MRADFFYLETKLGYPRGASLSTEGFFNIYRLVFQLYPEHVETITLYMADVTRGCASKEESLPIDVLNDIQLPNVQAKMLEYKK